MLETAIALIVVFALGYGVREWVSRRRHLEEKQQRRSLPEFLKSGGRPFVPNENFPQRHLGTGHISRRAPFRSRSFVRSTGARFAL